MHAGWSNALPRSLSNHIVNNDKKKQGILGAGRDGEIIQLGRDVLKRLEVDKPA